VRLTAAFLADAAQVTGGKLYVLGGAFDTIGARSFPVLHRGLTVVLVGEIGPGDRNRDLELEIRLLDEDGAEMGVASKGTIRVGTPSSLPAGATSLIPLAVPFVGLRFPKPGGYVFMVEHEEQELARIPFRVREATR
jgi:hypothetical protein